jgi:hypothetical protein
MNLAAGKPAPGVRDILAEDFARWETRQTPLPAQLGEAALKAMTEPRSSARSLEALDQFWALLGAERGLRA